MNTSRVLISACLLGEKVRYDGRDNKIEAPLVKQLLKEKRLVSVCPEVLGGLPTPRSFAQIEQRIPVKVVDSDSEDVTPQFLSGAEITLERARAEGCVAALMKSNSPACGNIEVMADSFTGRRVAGAGIAAQELIRAGIPVFNEQQLDQLEQLLNQIDNQEVCA